MHHAELILVGFYDRYCLLQVLTSSPFFISRLTACWIVTHRICLDPLPVFFFGSLCFILYFLLYFIKTSDEHPLKQPNGLFLYSSGNINRFIDVWKMGESQNESTIKVPIPFKLKALYIFLGKNPNVVVLVLKVILRVSVCLWIRDEWCQHRCSPLCAPRAGLVPVLPSTQSPCLFST